jgi:hypothetical protein
LRCSLWNSVSTSFERHSLISSKTPVKKKSHSFSIIHLNHLINNIILPKLLADNFAFCVSHKLQPMINNFKFSVMPKYAPIILDIYKSHSNRGVFYCHTLSLLYCGFLGCDTL